MWGEQSFNRIGNLGLDGKKLNLTEVDYEGAAKM
jgi:hypothetical protein